jgi:hypothetical protein
MTGDPSGTRAKDDAARAIKFLAVKFALFAVLPVVVAALVVYWQLG